MVWRPWGFYPASLEESVADACRNKPVAKQLFDRFPRFEASEATIAGWQESARACAGALVSQFEDGLPRLDPMQLTQARDLCLPANHRKNSPRRLPRALGNFLIFSSANSV